jgi:hypothetical protein
MAKGFPTGGGVLINIRVHPRAKEEIAYAAKQLECAAADIYREAVERWLIEYRKARAEADT